MTRLLKLGCVLTGIALLSAGQTLDNTGGRPTVRTQAGSFHTIPAPPPDPHSPKVPLSFHTIPAPPPDPHSPKVPLG